MSESQLPNQPELTSPPWQSGTRLVAALLLIALAGAALFQLHQLLLPFILAWLLAFLLHPLVTRLRKWTKWPRWTVILLVYLVLLLALAGVMTGLGLAVNRQLMGLLGDLKRLSLQVPAQLEAFSETTLTIGPWAIDLSQVDLDPFINTWVATIRPLLAESGAMLASVLGITASFVGLTLGGIVVAYYLLLDFESLNEAFLALIPKGYRGDFERLLRETGQVWRAFFRGRFILGLVVGMITAALFSVLGVRFALGLGLVAGLAEFVPVIGPLFAGFLAMVVAFFQEGNWWNMTPLVLAALVLVTAVAIQQIENNILVPRLLGRSLKIHPLVILLAAVAGGILAGALGVLLSTPVVATLRLWLGYIYRKTVAMDTQEMAYIEQ
jgi:predicted PurR-regulated permease PerM